MIPAAARRALTELLGERLRFGVPLARHTSLQVGGPAEALASPRCAADVATCAKLCHRYAIPLTPIGGGFNLLVCDGGLPGLVLRTDRLRTLAVDAGVEGERRGPALFAEAGVSHSQIARFAERQGLTGLEFAAGIPGSVGGWVAMNAGIPDREVGDAILDVDVATLCGDRERRSGTSMAFRYRAAAALAPGEVVVAARFALEAAAPARIGECVSRHLARRRRTQPLDRPSCGSVFKNPPGVRAGELIEAAGCKGVRTGGAEVSSLHANFIINRGGATAKDVLALIERVRERVLAQTGIALESEVRIVGERA